MTIFSYAILNQEQELDMKWITLWILSTTTLALLMLTYMYLNHQWEQYVIAISVLYGISTMLPYILWKYNQIKFVEKREIIIQILKD